MTTEQTYISKESETLDDIVFRYYGKTSDGVFEFVLEYNRGIAERGTRLPAGTQVILPVIPEEKQPDILRLWD
jgi:phage tail protein X